MGLTAFQPAAWHGRLKQWRLTSYMSSLTRVAAWLVVVADRRENVKVKVSQSCPTPWDLVNYLVHEILQARILEWVAFLSLLQGIFPTRDWTQVSRIADGLFTSWDTREAQEHWSGYSIPAPADLPDTGIEPGSPALEAESLPTELWGKPRREKPWVSTKTCTVSQKKRNEKKEAQKLIKKTENIAQSLS